MTKGEGGVYTGVLTLPKGTRFAVKILKSTVDGTSGGDNSWSAVRYASVLNSDAAHDFGEFLDNLIPNGDFEDADAKWTPAECVVDVKDALKGEKCLSIGDTSPVSASSASFVIPPNEDMRLSFYMFSFWTAPRTARVEVKDVNTQSVLFEIMPSTEAASNWKVYSGTFKSGDSPVTAQVVASNSRASEPFYFDSISLVSM
jgi:hypothetical protein|nr:MAG TPA: ENDO-1,4-BETA-XYLANASE Y [Caudoviricetes sp.]